MATPWHSFMGRDTPYSLTRQLNALLARHLSAVAASQFRGDTRQHEDAVLEGTSFFKRIMGSSQRELKLANTKQVEELCGSFLKVLGKRMPLAYSSSKECEDAQLALITLASMLVSYAKSSAFNARNAYGSNIHFPRSTQNIVYRTIIAIIDRPEFDFHDWMDQGEVLQGVCAHIAASYWRLLLTTLKLVLDLVFWAREEELQFAAGFFAIAIFRLPSVGGHVVDSLHQFHSRAAAHFRRLYPSSTRTSEINHFERRLSRVKHKNRSPATSEVGLRVGVSTNSDSGSNTFRLRSHSAVSLKFIKSNPVIFGWLNFQSRIPNLDSGEVVMTMKRRKREWNGRLRSSREFAMMLAAAVVDHVQNIAVSQKVIDATSESPRKSKAQKTVSESDVIWEEIPLYPVLADMVLVTLRRQFHLLVHPTDPSALDDFETQSALRSSRGFVHRPGEASKVISEAASRRSQGQINRYAEDNEDEEDVVEEQAGNLVFSQSFFDTIVATCSHFFTADPIMRRALLRMVCTHMHPNRVSSVGPCLGAIEVWLLRLHRVSPSSMAKAMQLSCVRAAISALFRSSRFVCICRALTFIGTVVQHLGNSDEAGKNNSDSSDVLWFLRDILFDHFFELMLSWSSFVRRFFHDFLVHRVFKVKRALLDIASDRMLFQQFPGGEIENRRNSSYNERVAMHDRVTQNYLLEGVNFAAIPPSETALATKMHAYVRILLNALTHPESFDDTVCAGAEQKRAYIRKSLEGYAELLYDIYCEQEVTPGLLAGEPPELDLDIESLMRRFSESRSVRS